MTSQPVTFESNAPIGEWNQHIQAFWLGSNDCEWVAHKGSHHIFVYPCGSYPGPPAKVIQHTGSIATLADFDKALKTGTVFEADYRPEGAPDPLEKLETQITRRLKRADATATDIKDKHAGKEQKQPEHPDTVKLRSLMTAEQLETETEYNYHGGRSLGFWEGRASALDSLLAVVHNLRKAGAQHD